MLENRGAIVEKVIRREGHSITDLAKLTGVHRRSIYNWFLQPRLKREIILKIGQAIRHDFSVEFPKQFMPEDFTAEAKSPVGLVNQKDLNLWKERYLDLIDRYNSLLTINKERRRCLPLPATRGCSTE